MKVLTRLFLILLILTTKSNAGNIFVEAGRKYNINPGLLYAIAVVESSLNPYAISVKGGSCREFPSVRCYERKGVVSLYPDSLSHARKVLQQVLGRGYYFDVGLMQISKYELERRGLDPFELLDYRKNTFVGAEILAEKIKRYGYSWEAVWRYNGRYSYAWKVREVYLRQFGGGSLNN